MDRCKACRIKAANTKKGISPLLSGVIFTAIIITTTSIIMGGIIPSLNDVRDTVVIDSAQESMNYLNQYIELVAQESERSQRVVPLSFSKGTFTIDSANTSEGDYGKFYFEIETDSLAVSPRASKKIGDITFSSNTNVSASVNTTEFILENEHLKISINRSGNSTDPVAINTSKLLKNIYLKDNSKTLFSGVSDHLRLSITGIPEIVTGYVDAKKLGEYLGAAEIIAYLNYSTIEYEIHFILESGTDYVKIRVISPQYFDWVETNVISTNFVTPASDFDSSLKYIESATAGTVLAIVSDNDAVTGEVSASNMIYLNQPFKINKIYLVFTRGQDGTVSDRLHYINDGTFENLYSPSFGFMIDTKNKIRLTLDYDSINLYADDSKNETSIKLQAGTYNLLVKNMGVAGGRTDVLIKLL